jgi:membrane protein implicated in regulation of membrane protease activity
VGLSKIIFVVVIGLVGWIVYKKFVADAVKLAKANAAKRREAETGAIGTLVKDPATGEYRLRKEEDR